MGGTIMMDFNLINRGSNLEKLVTVMVVCWVLLVSYVPDNSRVLYMEHFAGADGRLQENEVQAAVRMADSIGAVAVVKWIKDQK